MTETFTGRRYPPRGSPSLADLRVVRVDALARLLDLRRVQLLESRLVDLAEVVTRVLDGLDELLEGREEQLPVGADLRRDDRRDFGDRGLDQVDLGPEVVGVRRVQLLRRVLVLLAQLAIP